MRRALFDAEDVAPALDELPGGPEMEKTALGKDRDVERDPREGFEDRKSVV